ncbi:hypothetical protein [Paenibacillus sp. P46E]|uniref:hypothetical protein n=1 Tax=Paenibacillus sp. P46E TaxID=1349436 RepID=UPI0009403AF6|nr:hypothetical protein [Paenibacillus sp. P46E]OKP95300.1 hypothetical protein A3849_27370 [Paenibacillus sp. P46E]
MKIQFKFGDTWDYPYFINDEIKWGGNNIGIKGLSKVVLDGIAEPCTNCKAVVDYLIFIKKDVIQYIEKNIGQYDFTDSEGYYLILEE